MSLRPDHAGLSTSIGRRAFTRRSATDGSGLDRRRRTGSAADAIRLGHHDSRAGSDRPTILGLRPEEPSGAGPSHKRQPLDPHARSPGRAQAGCRRSPLARWSYRHLPHALRGHQRRTPRASGRGPRVTLRRLERTGPVGSDHGAGRRRRSERRAGTEAGLRRLQALSIPASSGTSGRSRAAAPSGTGSRAATLASGEPVGLVMIDGQ